MTKELLPGLGSGALREALDRPPPTEMRICEINHLVLHPNQTYRFTVDVNCKECVAYVAARPTPQASSEIRERVRQERVLVLEDVIKRLWERVGNEEYGHAKAAVALDIEAVEEMKAEAERALAPSRQGAGGK